MSIHLVQNKPKDARKGTPAMAKGKRQKAKRPTITYINDMKEDKQSIVNQSFQCGSGYLI